MLAVAHIDTLSSAQPPAAPISGSRLSDGVGHLESLVDQVDVLTRKLSQRSDELAASNRRSQELCVARIFASCRPPHDLRSLRERKLRELEQDLRAASEARAAAEQLASRSASDLRQRAAAQSSASSSSGGSGGDGATSSQAEKASSFPVQAGTVQQQQSIPIVVVIFAIIFGVLVGKLL
jgi:hypothetical protein